MGLLFFFTLLASIFDSHLTYFKIDVWIVLTICFMIANLLGVPKEFYNLRMVNALFSIPKVLIQMILVMFKLKGANRKFLHTAHGEEELQE